MRQFHYNEIFLTENKEMPYILFFHKNFIEQTNARVGRLLCGVQVRRLGLGSISTLVGVFDIG
ncbi:MAG: hypothetical protein D6712_03745, partial [Chloroflexi bacterium]